MIFSGAPIELTQEISFSTRHLEVESFFCMIKVEGSLVHCLRTKGVEPSSLVLHFDKTLNVTIIPLTDSQQLDNNLFGTLVYSPNLFSPSTPLWTLIGGEPWMESAGLYLIQLSNGIYVPVETEVPITLSKGGVIGEETGVLATAEGLEVISLGLSGEFFVPLAVLIGGESLLIDNRPVPVFAEVVENSALFEFYDALGGGVLELPDGEFTVRIHKSSSSGLIEILTPSREGDALRIVYNTAALSLDWMQVFLNGDLYSLPQKLPLFIAE